MKTKLTQILAQKMLDAQREMNHAVKDKKNDFLGNGYASLENVIGRAKEVYNNLDILFQQISHDNPDGATVETVFIGHGGCFSAGKVSVPVDKRDPQKFGSAITYARRYSLTLACGIGSVDDDAETAMGRDDSKQKKPVQQTKQKQKEESGTFYNIDNSILFTFEDVAEIFPYFLKWKEAEPDAPFGEILKKNMKVLESAKESAMSGTNPNPKVFEEIKKLIARGKKS